MSIYWSTYVQKTEELYFSRSLKFHDGNMWKWIDIMNLTDGMDILEVGCAGRCLCHANAEKGPEKWIPTAGDAEKELFDKLWAQASKNKKSNIKKHVSCFYKDARGFSTCCCA